MPASNHHPKHDPDLNALAGPSHGSEPTSSPSSTTGSSDKPTKTKSKPNTLRHLVIAAVVVIVVIVVTLLVHTNKTNAPSLTSSTTPPAQVAITATGFNPANITIKPNQVVVWTNDDSAAHLVASDPYPSDNALAGFKSPSSINTSQTYSFIFNKVGTYLYHDDLNPASFKGEVIVKR